MKLFKTMPGQIRLINPKRVSSSVLRRYGTVVGIAQHRWEDSNRKKGYGYIEFSDWDGAQVARLGLMSGVCLFKLCLVQSGLCGVTGCPGGDGDPPCQGEGAEGEQLHAGRDARRHGGQR